MVSWTEWNVFASRSSETLWLGILHLLNIFEDMRLFVTPAVFSVV